MATFVDHVGLNTLISSSFDDTNTITSNINHAIGSISGSEILVGINTHRGNRYGYSTWTQLRASQNPVTRNHRKNNKMSFVVQPGPVRNVLPNGDIRVRDRYSALQFYNEPAITQNSYPLVWNVGKHIRDRNGNISGQPRKFSIISSYGNELVGFANDKVSKLHRFNKDEKQTEYFTIKDMYLENGLNSEDTPITHWEFIQYRETVFPRPANQFRSPTRTRPRFTSFFRHDRLDRTIVYGGPGNTGAKADGFTQGFGWVNAFTDRYALSQSTWPLDEHEFFTTLTYNSLAGSIGWNFTTRFPSTANRFRGGQGGLMQTLSQYWATMSTYTSTSYLTSDTGSNVVAAAAIIDKSMAPGPLYTRRINLEHTRSIANPTGMLIDNTGSGTSYSLVEFQGGALWEAGSKRQVRNSDGTYTFAPKEPFYDTYENYVEDVKRRGKNYSIIPEFRMSTQVEDYLKTGGAIESDMFEVTGGITGLEDSSKSGPLASGAAEVSGSGDFYQIYSNTDFMKNFELIAEDHKDFTNGKVLSLRCKAIKKFLPYEGFYPCQRTLQLSKRFFDSFKDNIKFKNSDNIEINDFNLARQNILTPLFAPGVLFNTIKSGVAVDFPIKDRDLGVFAGLNMIVGDFDKRIPFEALVEPDKYLAGFQIANLEPHISASLSGSAEWDGLGDPAGIYSAMANNFLAESISFFLKNGQLSSIVSKKQKDITLQSGSVYSMRIRMRRSMNKTRGSITHQTGSTSYLPPQDVSIEDGDNLLRETFTMYSRPSAFGPPSMGGTQALGAAIAPSFTFHRFEQSGHTDGELSYSHNGTTAIFRYFRDSRHGYNYPYTPPYYHGEGWCHITFTASSDTMTIKEIQEASEYEYTRFDKSHLKVSSESGSFFSYNGGSDVAFTNYGPQSPGSLDANAVQLSASLNIKGVGTIQTATNGATAGNLIVDSGEQENNRWVIQTKFETPMLNFNHITSPDHLTLPAYGSGSVPRGMWHQYGRIPEQNEGVFIQVGPIPDNYQEKVLDRTGGSATRGNPGNLALDASEALGFSGIGTKLGMLAESKVISEAVVAIPFIQVEGRKKFFKLSISEEMFTSYMNGDIALLTNGPPSSQIGRSALKQMDKMKKYIFPPSFDFLNFPNVDPIAMYIFEFSHTLTQTDLQDIWQNLPPDIATDLEIQEVAITHPLLKKELLGPPGDENGNATIEMPKNLKWMVFKVKQRADSNYLKKTVLRNPEVNVSAGASNVSQDQFGPTRTVQFNWPYDFFSLVEMVKIDSEVEMGNFNEDELKNYVDHIPSWDPVETERPEDVLTGLEDDPLHSASPSDENGPGPGFYTSHDPDDDRTPGDPGIPDGFDPFDPKDTRPGEDGSDDELPGSQPEAPDRETETGSDDERDLDSNETSENNAPTGNL